MNDTTTLQKSLLMIQKLKRLLEEQNDGVVEPVAIIGMSCRLPEANNVQAFWQLLCEGKNVISAIPDARWELLQDTSERAKRDRNLAYWGGYLKDIAEFDAYFFGISPREALRMDPQQRHLLEVAYEAFEDAGITAEALAGSNTGVFSSLYASQFGHLQSLDSDMDALFVPTGSAISIAANRLSYLFDLRGPSMVLDTACSSSLINVQLACLNLQAKLCDQALVSAVNINLLPSIHSVLAKATMLSPTGQCHTFDAKADGYVQGEGVCAIVLKPLSKALRDKDRIYAVVAGSAVNQDGKTNGLTAPNGLQQEALLRTAYRKARIDPATVSYVECHGTGTFLGDPIEAQALGAVLGKGRPADQPCWLGSVKTNVGHLEPAAGLVGVIKVALMLQHGLMPPHLNMTTPNPHIAFAQHNLNIPKSLEVLPRYGTSCVAGISGFGFGGSNAHLVLRSIAAEIPAQEGQAPTGIRELFTLSAKDEGALYALIALWRDYVQQHLEINLAQLCYNVHVRRSHYPYRLCILVDSVPALHQKLSDLAADYQGAHDAVFISRTLKKTQTFAPISSFTSMDAATLATHYINQANIDWQQYESQRFYPLLEMPAYPWQHKKYWPSLGAAAVVEPIDYPMRGRMLASPLSSQQFEFVFDTTVLPEIEDTFHVLHAGFYLEMLTYATQQLQQASPFSIQGLEFLSPLIVLHKKTVIVHLIIAANEQQEQQFTFYSNDGKNNWIAHAQGIIVGAAASSAAPDTFQDFLHGREDRGNAETFYDRVLSMGMPAGDTVRWTDKYWCHADEIGCELRSPKAVERGEQFAMQLHPGIIDACIQSLFLLLPSALTKPYVASNMGKITFYGPITSSPRYIYSHLKETAAEGKYFIADWSLLDSEHRMIAHCDNLVMTQLNNTVKIEHMMDVQSQFQLDLSLPTEVCRESIQQYLCEQMATIFSMPVSDVDVNRPLPELGMDSLMAMAVSRIVETDLAVTYSLPELLQGVSIADITQRVLADKLMADEPVPTVAWALAKENSWLAHRSIQPQAKMRLFCFPFGGGGASIYREWQHGCSDAIELCPVQLPGRENRMDEEAIANLDTLLPLLAQNLQPLFDMPFAFIGHSFGSLIAFEFARYLRRHQLPQPMHLFISAFPDPRLPSRSLHHLLDNLQHKGLNLFDLDQHAISQLNDQQLTALSLIFKENGIVDYSDVRMSKDIIQILLPIFIGDMNIVKSYKYQEELALDLTMTVFLGTHDTWVLPEEHAGWSHHALLGCTFRAFDRGHLFIREQEIRAQMIEHIHDVLLGATMEVV